MRDKNCKSFMVGMEFSRVECVQEEGAVPCQRAQHDMLRRGHDMMPTGGSIVSVKVLNGKLSSAQSLSGAVVPLSSWQEIQPTPRGASPDESCMASSLTFLDQHRLKVISMIYASPLKKITSRASSSTPRALAMTPRIFAANLDLRGVPSSWCTLVRRQAAVV